VYPRPQPSSASARASSIAATFGEITSLCICTSITMYTIYHSRLPHHAEVYAFVSLLFRFFVNTYFNFHSINLLYFQFHLPSLSHPRIFQSIHRNYVTKYHFLPAPMQTSLPIATQRSFLRPRTHPSISIAAPYLSCSTKSSVTGKIETHSASLTVQLCMNSVTFRLAYSIACYVISELDIHSSVHRPPIFLSLYPRPQKSRD
jgi:hypothetical protein